MKTGELHVDKVRKQKETRRDMMKSKRNNLKEEPQREPCDDDLQMKAAERLYSIVTTEIHDARNRTNSFLYKGIG